MWYKKKLNQKWLEYIKKEVINLDWLKRREHQTSNHGSKLKKSSDHLWRPTGEM